MGLKKKYKDIGTPPVARPSEGGFTLVEIMVAIVVLSIGLFIVASMQISAVDTNASAGRMTESVNLAQEMIEELMILEYNESSTDPDLMDDGTMVGGSESFTDLNGNGLWDFSEPYTDANGNGAWDAAHVDPIPQPGYTITWSVIDNRPVSMAKLIRVYVTRHDIQKTVMLSCIKTRK